MEIVRLYIRGEEKRGVVDRMVLEEGVGILGQVQGKEDRQVSVLPGEVRQALENMEEHGLCTQRFQENITIDQLDLGEWGPGDRMRMGEVLVEITRLEKSCFSDCPLLRSHSKCPLAKGVLYAKVVEGGTLQKGKVCLRFNEKVVSVLTYDFMKNRNTMLLAGYPLNCELY